MSYGVIRFCIITTFCPERIGGCDGQALNPKKTTRNTVPYGEKNHKKHTVGIGIGTASAVLDTSVGPEPHCSRVGHRHCRGGHAGVSCAVTVL